MSAGTTRADARRRWPALRDAEPVLRVGVLASYTIDPLTPHLGVRLHDAGLPARFVMGPYNQIVQQCLDDTADLARADLDVLLVAPRFEELAGAGGATGAAGAAGPGGAAGFGGAAGGAGGATDLGAELAQVVDVALAAAGRWGCRLVFVLPPTPAHRPRGVGELADPDGVPAAAARARERARRALAGRPGVSVADAEDAVREVGAARAHNPTMYRVAKVPFSEELFDRLAAQLAAVLAVAYGGGVRAVLVDLDDLPLDDLEEGAPAAAALAALLDTLAGAGVRLGVRGTTEPRHAGPVLDRCRTRFLDARALGVHVALAASDLDVPTDQLAVLTGHGTAGTDEAYRVVGLGDRPERWADEARAAGAFDRLPPPAPPRVTAEAAPPAPGLSTVDAYVAGLGVRVRVEEVDADRVTELVARAKDFTLGTSEVPDGVTCLAASVRDRLGDHGLGGAVGYRADGADLTVELFSLSCPVLGKGVEDAVLGELIAVSERAGCSRVVLNYRDTGDNRTLLTFLSRIDGTTVAGPGGHDVEIAAKPLAVRQ